MSFSSTTEPQLPIIPAPRPDGCPLAPPAEYAQWREEGGLRWAMDLFIGGPGWVASRYEDIRAALVDPRLSAKTIPNVMTPSGEDNQAAVIFPRTDDPEHNFIRRMLTRDFTVRRAKEMAPGIQRLVDELLDKMIAAGPPCSFVKDFALPLPSSVICMLLGAPYEDHAYFEKFSVDAFDTNTAEERRVELMLGMFAYLNKLLERKKTEPGDDMLSRLMNDNVAKGEISVATAAVTGLIMLQAGHETTASMLALGMVVLLNHPDAMARLRESDDPVAHLQIVDELLRYLTILHGGVVDRVATEDLQMCGRTVKAGDRVMMNLTAGNYDSAFTPNPERFDIGRDTRGHLAFGYGVHQCIGQNLARAELQIALTTIARRLPNLKLAVPFDELNFMNLQVVHRIEELPLTW
jgi:cytochrome P450